MSKVYKKFESMRLEDPDRIKELRREVESLGDIYVDLETLQALYFQFSDEVYNMRRADTHDSEVIESFIEWLDDYDLEENYNKLMTYFI